VSDGIRVARARERRAGRRRLAVLVLAGAAALLIADWFAGGMSRDLLLGMAQLTVTSVPSGAEVRVDGIERGATPLTIPVRPGARTLLVSHPYHPPQVQHFELARGERLELAVTLAPAYGSLLIASNPAGAQVRVDGVLQQGVTPLRLESVRAGQHEIELAIAGRIAEIEIVEVLPGSRSELLVQLDRLPRGLLQVDTVPANAVVELIDGSGTVHRAGTVLTVGDYHLRVRAPGYRTLEEPFELLVGERRIERVLEPVIPDSLDRGSPRG